MQVVVVGGGWAGCSAALAAAKAGARATLLERTDMLLGAGLSGGIMRNNGRYTAAEEAAAMGAGDLFAVADDNSRHRGIEFPGHKHASLYDVTRIEPAVRQALSAAGVQVFTQCRIISVKVDGENVRSVATADGEAWEAGAFVDATGSAGPMGSCAKYGNGCAMCIFRCPSFGPRQGLARLSGAREFAVTGQRPEPGVFSGSCDLVKGSLAADIVKTLDRDGVVVVPLPEELINRSKLASKACQQYALGPYAENLIILDNGYGKLMSPYFPLDDLRTIPGFERARYAEPLAGGKGNSIRYTCIAERDQSLRVGALENLFCCGEKSGPYVGHTEAIVTGALAGRNAAARAAGKGLLVLGRNTAIGDFIAMAQDELAGSSGFPRTLTFAGASFFERMKQRGLYTTDREEIGARVRAEGLEGVFERPVA
ncbi:MAG: FAD-dependent oxidoreductase [Firmicutes bacterium]|nr:FAD-dependent oxidoreductase [Bacillota bacterium]